MVEFDIQVLNINICMADEGNIDEEVNDLISQLKDNRKAVREIRKRDDFELKSEELEQFILNSTGKLIQDSMDMVDTVKQYVECAPDADGVGSLAELLKATTSSIDTLCKILVQDKKGNTAVGIKQLDIASKQQLMQTDHNNKISLTRQEVLDGLIKNAEIIEDKPDAQLPNID